MKKIFTLFFLVLAAFSATADSYLTIGTSDTILLHPNLLGNAYNFSVRAHFEGRLDYWYLTMSYPPGLSYNRAEEWRHAGFRPDTGHLMAYLKNMVYSSLKFILG